MKLCAFAPVHKEILPISANPAKRTIGDLLTINTLYAAKNSPANLICMAQQANR
jgi:hypothetical protein